jgi:ssDNA-binding Zn-finger/Zn-ribbon topoisomerase 1
MKNKLIDALNRMDELASIATQDNDNGEAEQLEKDYNLLFNFISEPEACIKSAKAWRTIQEEALTKPCPNCHTGELHEVEGTDGVEENMLWCNNCDLSMDSDGGYTK